MAVKLSMHDLLARHGLYSRALSEHAPELALFDRLSRTQRNAVTALLEQYLEQGRNDLAEQLLWLAVPCVVLGQVTRTGDNCWRVTINGATRTVTQVDAEADTYQCVLEPADGSVPTAAEHQGDCVEVMAAKIPGPSRDAARRKARPAALSSVTATPRDRHPTSGVLGNSPGSPEVVVFLR